MREHQFKTAPGIEIAPADYLDLAEMVAIQRQAFLDTYTDVNSEITASVMRKYVSGRWTDQMEEYYRYGLDRGSRLLVAIIAERLVGFCSVEGHGYIDALFIEAEYRQRRLGSALLLAHGEAGAFDRGASLHVVDGTPAKEVYQRIGFRLTGEKTPTGLVADCYLYHLRMTMNQEMAAQAMARLRAQCEAAGIVMPDDS